MSGSDGAERETDRQTEGTASAWPLAGQPLKVDCDLHTIARAHNRTFFVRLVWALCPHVPAVECSIMYVYTDHAPTAVLVTP